MIITFKQKIMNNITKQMLNSAIVFLKMYNLTIAEVNDFDYISDILDIWGEHCFGIELTDTQKRLVLTAFLKN